MRRSTLKNKLRYVLNDKLTGPEKLIMISVMVESESGEKIIDSNMIANRAGITPTVAKIFIDDLIKRGNVSINQVKKRASIFEHHYISAKYISLITS